MSALRNSPFDHHRGTRPLLQPIRSWRMILFITINVMGFAVVSAFWQYLSTGTWVNFNAFFRNLFIPLGVVFLQPISIFTHPWMVPVYGLLLSVTVFVPIVVSILYRLRLAAIFVLMLAFVAQLPLLALVVVTGCVMVGHTPLRSNMPMAAALLGMLPAVVYAAVLGCPTLAGTTDRDYWATIDPVRRWMLYSPYLLALLSSIVGSALVLALAKATRFRPGVVWPVLLVLSAAPMVAFYLRVGPAELQYSLIVNQIAPGDTVLADEPFDQWLRDHPETVGLTGEQIEEIARRDLFRRRDELVTRCARLLASYPQDTRAAEVMWILTQCRSLQLDDIAYQNDIIKGTCSFVRSSTEPAWRELIEKYPRSPQAAIARWRLAELALRNEQLPATDRLKFAEELLRQGVASLTEVLSSHAPAEDPQSLFAQPQSLPARSYYVNALHDTLRLQRLINLNMLRDDPFGVDILTAWLNIDPTSLEAPELYEHLARLHRDTPLGDNLRLAAALAEPDRVERARKLLPLVNVQKPTDATVEAAYELALIQAEGVTDLEGILPAEVYLRSVIAAPKNPWRDLAAKRLKLILIEREMSQ